MGHGVLIYFGYPQAHEDDADRAVRAGLAIIDAVGALNKSQPLAVRLGIATGLAVVGDLIGEGAAQERGVVGETPNLAARLQGLAAPNTLIIGEATRRQIGGLFDLEDLGPQQLAGFVKTLPAWRVLGESGEVSRFEALRSGETPLVGRDEEVDLTRPARSPGCVDAGRPRFWCWWRLAASSGTGWAGANGAPRMHRSCVDRAPFRRKPGRNLLT